MRAVGNCLWFTVERTPAADALIQTILLASLCCAGKNKTVMNLARDSAKGSPAMDDDDDDDSPQSGKLRVDQSTDVACQLELRYMVFDILYVQDQSVINRKLSERHEFLRAAIAQTEPVAIMPAGAAEPVFGTIQLVVPGSPWSQPVTNAASVRDMMRKVVDNNEEGIVFKDLASQWQKGDRSAAWMKLKPDYLPSTSDLVRRLEARACDACHMR